MSNSSKNRKKNGGKPRNNSQKHNKTNFATSIPAGRANEHENLRVFCSGDWNDKSRWSPQASRQMWTVGLRHDNYQQEIDNTARKVVIRQLVDDIHIAVLPRTIAQSIKSDPDAMTDMLVEGLYLMQQYGRHGVLCGDTLPTAYCKRAIKIEEGLWLVNASVGMPLEQFVYHLVDGCPYSVIEEWSGVPRQLIDKVYSSLIGWMRNRVAEEHQMAAQYEPDDVPKRKFSVRGRNVGSFDISVTF